SLPDPWKERVGIVRGTPMNQIRLRVVNADAAYDIPDGHFWARASIVILADQDVPDSAFRVLVAITALANSKHICLATTEQIAKECGKSIPAVERSIRRLAELGILSRDGAGPSRKLALCIRFNNGSK